MEGRIGKSPDVAENLRFQSKVGVTFGLVTMLFVAIAGGALITSVKAHAIIVSAVLVLFLAGYSWIGLSTTYTVTPTELLVRSGPVRRTIPLDSIWRLRASRASWASPALRLDRAIGRPTLS